MQVQMGEEGFGVWRRSVDKLTRLDVDEVHFAHDANYTRRNDPDVVGADTDADLHWQDDRR